MLLTVIKLVKYQRYVKNYKQEKIRKVSRELTTEFKQVLLNDSESIPTELFKCQAKIDDDGKIVCKIKLEYEMKIENYKDFSRFFHFAQKNCY